MIAGDSFVTVTEGDCHSAKPPCNAETPVTVTEGDCHTDPEVSLSTVS